MDPLGQIKDDIHCMRAEINDLQNEVRALMKLVSESHTKMNQHVDFVENVYTSVRHPLDFVKRRIESWTGHNSSSMLPQLNNGNGNGDGEICVVSNN